MLMPSIEFIFLAFAKIFDFVFSIDIGGITLGAIFIFFFVNALLFKFFTGATGNFTVAKRSVRKDTKK